MYCHLEKNLTQLHGKVVLAVGIERSPNIFHENQYIRSVLQNNIIQQFSYMDIDIDMNYAIKHLFEIKVATRVILQLMQVQGPSDTKSSWHEELIFGMLPNFPSSILLFPGNSSRPLCPVSCPVSWVLVLSWVHVYRPFHSSYQPSSVSETISWISTSAVTCACVSEPGPFIQQTLLLKQQIVMTIKAKVHEDKKIKAWSGSNTTVR